MFIRVTSIVIKVFVKKKIYCNQSSGLYPLNM